MLDGRVVVVTGAARGIGRAHARRAAEHGARVVLNDIDGADEAAAMLRSDGLEVVADNADVSTWDGAAALIGAALTAFGRLDGLVNNAGVLRRHDVADLTEESLALEFGVNVHATFACTRHASHHWRERARAGEAVDASVVYTASDTIFTGSPGGSGYAATKAAVVALAQTASIEGAQYGVRHNVICPSGRTMMAANSRLLAFGEADVALPEDQDPASPENPLHNSPIVMWLLSTRSRHVSGQVFRLRHGAFSRMEPVACGAWQPPPAGSSAWDLEQLADAVDQTVFGCRYPAPIREFPDGTSEPFIRLDHQ